MNVVKNYPQNWYVEEEEEVERVTSESEILNGNSTQSYFFGGKCFCSLGCDDGTTQCDELLHG